MTPRYLLDTDFCIFVLRNRPPQVRARFVAAEGQLAISAVTYMELLHGAERSADPPRHASEVERMVGRTVLLDYGRGAARHTGQIRAVLASSGRPIGPYDSMIAGHARSEGLILVTNNSREFERAPGLIVENWLAS